MKKKISLRVTLLGAVAAFCTYTSMYGFRKGITAVKFEGLEFLGIDYKIWLITAQVFGYALSKRIGVKVVAEMKPAQRPLFVIGLVLLSELALVGFALVPAPANIIFLFLNGLPLGMVYGTVLGFLEGRRQTEVLISALTASFIFASGVVKTVAFLLMSYGVTELWAPSLTGLIFVIPLGVSVWGLSKLPPPTYEDEEARTERRPMGVVERKAFVRNFSSGLLLLIVSYVILSAFRDFRDNFAPEILGPSATGDMTIFAKTETVIAVIILVLMAGLRYVTDNFKAFSYINILMLFGALTVGVSTWMYEAHLLSTGVWFMLTGLGMYMAYVPCNGLYFERMVASFQYVSTVGFIVTLADWYGYLGSVGVLLYKNFGQPDSSFQNFFIYGCYGLCFFYSLLTILSYSYFRRKHQGSMEMSKVGEPV